MRTPKQFMQKMQDAHSCEKNEGKIFAVGMDKLGNKFCAYCGRKVNYPNPTEEEIKEILRKIKSGEGKIEESNIL